MRTLGVWTCHLDEQFADRVEKGNLSDPTPRQGPYHAALTYAASH